MIVYILVKEWWMIDNVFESCKKKKKKKKWYRVEYNMILL